MSLRIIRIQSSLQSVNCVDEEGSRQVTVQKQLAKA